MLKDWILRSSSRRYICKLVSIVTGIAVVAFVTLERLTALSIVLWTASPLVLFWLVDVGLATEQRRCIELLKKNPAKDDPSALLWEGGDAGLFRFVRALVSLSTWPFYFVLFALIGFGGNEITKANREVEAKAAEKVATIAPAPPYYQQGKMPTGPVRPPNAPIPINPVNSATQRFTPPQFATPPRFPVPNSRPAVPPPKIAMTPTPLPSPASSPTPPAKNP